MRIFSTSVLYSEIKHSIFQVPITLTIINYFPFFSCYFLLCFLSLFMQNNIQYRCNSFIVDLRHKFTVRNMNGIPVFVQSSELSNIT